MKTKQTRLKTITKIRRKINSEQINYIVNVDNIQTQRIMLFEGCPHNCPFCYEPESMKQWQIPEINCGSVQILDMNFLVQPNVLERINELGLKRHINSRKRVFYELVCGCDFRFLTEEIALALKKNKFILPRIAWDWGLKDQYNMKKAIKLLLKVNYKPREIGVFMIVNWKIPLKVCDLKLDFLKKWNVRVCDTCYDGGYDLAVPEFWTQKEIDYFKNKCKLHNQLINFGIYPDLSRVQRFINEI